MCTVFSVVSALPITDGWQRGEAALASKSCTAGLDPALYCFRATRFGFFPLVPLSVVWPVALWCTFRVRRIPLEIGTVSLGSLRFFFFLFLPGQLSCRNVAKIYECALRYFVCFSERGDRALSPFRLNLKRLSQRCSVRGFVACIPAFSRQCVVCL